MVADISSDVLISNTHHPIQGSSNPYEGNKMVNEYMAFHYAPPEEYMGYVFGPKEALDFPKRCAELCLKHKQVSKIAFG